VSGTAHYVCPKCGQPIDWIERRVVRRKGRDGQVHEHTYYYAWHFVRGPEGQRKAKKCYLGPDKYAYANVIQGKLGVQVKGLIQEVVEGRPLIIDYLEDIAKAIEDRMAKGQMSAHTAQQLADRLQELTARLRQYAQQRAVEESKARMGGDGQ
jgi:RNA polymerase-binding transcription factor DksA